MKRSTDPSVKTSQRGGWSSWAFRKTHRCTLATWMLALIACAHVSQAWSQSIAVPWTGHGHDPQHTGNSLFTAQPLNQIHWQTPIDLDPQYSGSELLIHYGSPLVTRGNTVLIPVKTGATSGFRVDARSGTDGTLLWSQTTDYTLPSASWTPMYGLALTPKNRLYFAGAGGTVYYRDFPDVANPLPPFSGQLAFYGLTNYQAAETIFNENVQINTPITSDRYGTIYFGFIVNGATTPSLQSGLARIDVNGNGSWVAATSLAGNDAGVIQVVHNCAPALSNDQKTLYVAVSYGDFNAGYLVSCDSRTLAPIAHIRLKDAINTTLDASLTNDATATPAVGPDGDVYFGVLANPYWSNNYRGWLLHFDSTLTQTKTPGAFGWDDTPSLVRASLVPSYHGTSQYLLLCKYNNYAEGGGTGVNQVAIVDPNTSMADPISGATVMNQVIAVTGPTPDPEFTEAGFPNAVREWCINTVAIDPFSKSAIINSEDGNIYRWDFATNTLNQKLNLTEGIGEAYTPTVIGVDGTVYGIGNAILFAIGR